jgi:PadR family transcriptional regulator PadR
MSRPRRPSDQTVAVLASLARRPRDWRHGYELSQELGIKAGSMYPILMRLADRGQLETSWESEPGAGRPARHLYRITKAGLALIAELSTHEAARGRLTRVHLRSEGA